MAWHSIHDDTETRARRPALIWSLRAARSDPRRNGRDPTLRGPDWIPPNSSLAKNSLRGEVSPRVTEDSGQRHVRTPTDCEHASTPRGDVCVDCKTGVSPPRSAGYCKRRYAYGEKKAPSALHTN